MAIEEISRASSAVGIMVAVHNSVGIFPVATFGNEEQKKKYLPRMAEGAVSGMAQTEPNAGSDPGSMECTAIKDGDDYVLNGTKIFVTNGGIGEIFLILAKTDPAVGKKSITGFMVEKGTPGFTVGKRERKMGMKASDTVEFCFSDCRVPANQMLGQEGMGLRISLTALDGGRLGVGAQAVGIAQAAFDEALRYACERVQFGAPISSLQAIQWMLSDMDTQLSAARLMVYEAAWLKDQGKPYTSESAKCKLFASEMATALTYHAIQVHGGYGYMKDYPVERYYREARLTEIYEGTSEIQRLVIARNLIRSCTAGSGS
jgi:butyryl-CoA dehydrogenase